MRLASILLGTFLLAGCSTFSSLSFYDDNESLLSVKVRLYASSLDCSYKQEPQVKAIQMSVNEFLFYSEAKRSKDVTEMILPMKETVDGFYERIKKNDSIAFCEIKKKIIVQQSSTIADAVMRRF